MLTDPAEVELRAAVEALASDASDTISAFADASPRLVAAIGRFFDETLVMADDEAVKASRLGLLAAVLDRVPRGIDWRALDLALG